MSKLIRMGELIHSIEAKRCLANTCREVGEKLIRAGRLELGARYLKQAIDYAMEVLTLRNTLRGETNERISVRNDLLDTGDLVCDRLSDSITLPEESCGSSRATSSVEGEDGDGHGKYATRYEGERNLAQIECDEEPSS